MIKSKLTVALFFVCLLFWSNDSNAQFGKFKKAARTGKAVKDVVDSNSSTKSSGSKSSTSSGELFTRNILESRFGSFDGVEMRSKTSTKKGQSYEEYHFGASNKLAFKLTPRFVYDDYSRGFDGVYSSNFVNEGEEVFHIDELKSVTDANGEKHSFTPVPSPTKRVIKTPDNVYLVYAFNNNKKVGDRYPYFASSKSEFTGPFVIAAPNAAKFDEWSGQKAMDYVKDFENRVKIGCFKFMPKQGKLHDATTSKNAEAAIYKYLRKYKNNANLEIRRLVVYSDAWEEVRDDVTDEVTERELMTYYMYVNGDDTDIHGAKIVQKSTGSGFNNDYEVKKTVSDKFSKDIPVSLVNKYFK